MCRSSFLAGCPTPPTTPPSSSTTRWAPSFSDSPQFTSRSISAARRAFSCWWRSWGWKTGVVCFFFEKIHVAPIWFSKSLASLRYRVDQLKLILASWKIWIGLRWSSDSITLFKKKLMKWNRIVSLSEWSSKILRYYIGNSFWTYSLGRVPKKGGKLWSFTMPTSDPPSPPGYGKIPYFPPIFLLFPNLSGTSRAFVRT